MLEEIFYRICIKTATISFKMWPVSWWFELLRCEMYDLQKTPLPSMWCKHTLQHAISSKTIVFLRNTGNITAPSFYRWRRKHYNKRYLSKNKNSDTRVSQLLCSFTDVCLPCFVPLKCCDVNCLGSMSLTPNLTESIVVVTEQGKNNIQCRPYSKDYLII